jgi:hypothetical protein
MIGDGLEAIEGKPTSLSDSEHTSFRKKALASLAATAGMLLLPVAYLMLDTYGPSGRIVFYEYLPFFEAPKYALAGMLGAWLGARVYRLFDRQTHYSVARLAAGCLLGGSLGFAAAAVAMFSPLQSSWIHASLFPGVVLVPVAGAWLGGIALFKSTAPAGHRRFQWLQPTAVCLAIVWLLIPQFRAFPKNAPLAEREAWARQHVPQYGSLTRIVGSVPVVAQDVGRIVGIAPTADDAHIAGRDMDGVGMNFTLDVVGEKGHGVFRVRCTIDGDTVWAWESGTWTFNGQTTEIATVPNVVHPKR